MIMELPIAMLACARIGAVHSIVVSKIISVTDIYLFCQILELISNVFSLKYV